MTYTDRSAISASTPEPTKFLRKGVAALALATAWIVLLALFQIAPAGAQSGGGHTGSYVFSEHLEPRLGPWQMPRVFC